MQRLYNNADAVVPRTTSSGGSRMVCGLSLTLDPLLRRLNPAGQFLNRQAAQVILVLADGGKRQPVDQYDDIVEPHHSQILPGTHRPRWCAACSTASAI